MDIIVTRAMRGCVTVAVVDEQGVALDMATYRPTTERLRHQQALRIAALFAVEVEMIERELEAAITEEVQRPEIEQEAPPMSPIRMRGRHELAANAMVFAPEPDMPTALRQALEETAYRATEPVLEWKGKEWLCVLDVDYHGDRLPPSHRELDRLVALLHPRPVVWWRSHGGGLHAVYKATHQFSAEELAACAALHILGLDPLCTVELKSESRHPAYRRGSDSCGPIRWETATPDIGALASWLRAEVDPPAVEEWLQENGFEIGRRYPHARCPIDPDRESHGDPVAVGDDGIFCHSCAAHGVVFKNAGRAGWVPWSRLVATRRMNRVREAAENLVYWDHAKFVVREDMGVPDQIGKAAYSAMLKALHDPDDPRLQACMHSYWWVRGQQQWLHAASLAPVMPALSREALRTVPSTQFARRNIAGEWNVGVDSKLLELHGSNGMIPGFLEIAPIRGMRVWGQHQTYSRKNVLHVSLNNAEHAPQYRPQGARMNEERAWRVVERSFPGIHRGYVELLIAARGFAESEDGPLPMVFCEAPSQAGKSQTVWLVASMLGDDVGVVPPDLQGERFSEHFGTRAASAGFVIIDEICKNTSEQGSVARLNPLLQIQRRYSYRQLYVGPVVQTLSSAVILTDIEVPERVRNDRQIGRRIVFVSLSRKVPDWELTAKADIMRWREMDKEHQDACDSIVSCVIDRWFAPETNMSFHEVAKKLGFTRLDATASSLSGVNKAALIRELFNAVCANLKPAPPSSAWKGPGWQITEVGAADRLSQAWSAVHDEENPRASRMVQEEDLVTLLDLDEPACKLRISPHGRYVAIRFDNGAHGNSVDFRVNAQLRRKDTPPTPPAPSGPVDGGVSPRAATAFDALSRLFNRGTNEPRAQTQAVTTQETARPSGEQRARASAAATANTRVGTEAGDRAGRDQGLAAAGARVAGAKDSGDGLRGSDGDLRVRPVSMAGSILNFLAGQRQPAGDGKSEPVNGLDHPADSGAGTPRADRNDAHAAVAAQRVGGDVAGSDRGVAGAVDSTRAGRSGQHNEPANRRPAAPSGDDDRVPAQAREWDGGAELTPLLFDLETRSFANLKAVGGRAYAADPTTQIVLFTGFDSKTGEMLVWTPLLNELLDANAVWPTENNPFERVPVRMMSGPELPVRIADAIESCGVMVAHNCYHFDKLVWEGRGLPQPAMWLDTLPMARILGLDTGELGEIGLRLFGAPKDKGKDLAIRLSKPHKGQFLALNRQNMTAVTRYGIKDTLILAGLFEKVAPLVSPTEARVIEVDRAINSRGIMADTDLAAWCIREWDAQAARTNEEIERITGGALRVGDLKSTNKLQAYLRLHGVNLPNLQGSTIEAFLNGDLINDDEEGYDE